MEKSGKSFNMFKQIWYKWSYADFPSNAKKVFGGEVCVNV